MKRVFDLVVVVGSAPVWLPLLAGLWLLVRARMGKPALFTQVRLGRHGTEFRLYKFRTMTDARDASGALLPDGDRLTPFGKWLRSTSLDELPELWNILKGEMSLVGPRPLPSRYRDRYSPEQWHRHDVMPGLTGWAQVNGRNAVTWDQRFALDLWYVQNHGFWLDLKILWLTVASVLSRHGVSAEGEATMSEFRGTSLSADAARSRPGSAETDMGAGDAPAALR